MRKPTPLQPATSADVGSFAGPGEVADCTAIIVTYNSAAHIPGLLATLSQSAPGLRLRVVVVDNASTDGIEPVVADHPELIFIPAGENLGYAGGINVGRRHLGSTRSVLILNPDLRLGASSVRNLLKALDEPGVGAVVPRILDDDGRVFPSLRREPTVGRALGDALLGKRWPGRPSWLSEMIWASEPYDHPAVVDWATGAAILISAETDAAVGAWDDSRFFLYSEETDYCRRIRQAGWTIRYVPEATVTHSGSGSGSGPELVALNAINRIRYYHKYHGPYASEAIRAVTVLNALLRVRRPGSRLALRAALSRRIRSGLPGPQE